MNADRRGWGVVAGITVVVLLLDALRVFLPSIIFIYGRAGSTPATTMGLFAAGWFAAGFLALLLVRWLGARRVAVGSATGFLVARLALLATDGGDPQLYLAGVSFVLAAWTLVAIADGSADRWPALGAVLALPAAVLLHVGLGTVDPQWQDGATGWVIVGLLGTAAIAGAAGMGTTPGDADVDGQPAPAGFWWRAGLALLLTGILTAVPSWSTVELAGGQESSRLLALVVLQLVAVAFVLLFDGSTGGQGTGDRARASGLRWVSIAVLLAAVAATVWGFGGPFGASGIVGVFLAVILHAHSTRTPGDTRRTGVGAATGALLMGALGFVFYAGYDISLGDNRLLLLLATLLLAPRPSAPPVRGPLAGSRRLGGPGLVGATLGTVIVLVAAGLLSPTSPRFEATDPTSEVRVAVANIHMGWDTEGRFAIDQNTEDLAALDADIIVLNEVDRGWLLTGGHDTLRLLSDRLDLPYAFAPAADEIWGNAILSRHPLDSIEVEQLPRGGVPMRRSVITAVAVMGGEWALGIVGTHLHHLEDDDSVRAEQATAVAEVAADLVAAGLPGVLLGDLNATPGDAALSSLTDLFEDAVASADPLPTYPSWEPEDRIDHILASPGLVVTEIERGGSPDSSDHLWLAVTITLP